MGPPRSQQQRFRRDDSAFLTRQYGNSEMTSHDIPLRWDWCNEPVSNQSVELNVNHWPSTAKNEQFAHRMATLNDEKSKENDPQKLAQLKEREASLIEKHEDATEKLCCHICEGMPQQ
jgi:hypothetical protein